MNRSAIATLVDPTSRFVHLVALPADHGAEAVRDGLIGLFRGLPELSRLTLTWDQGSEMALREDIAEHFCEGVYFAYPASPWQRGTNENTNGLLRQYFPKRTDLSVHTQAELQTVADRLNSRSRKTLGWRTLAEIHAAALAR